MKKLLAILLALLMVLSLFACGETAKTEPEKTDKTPEKESSTPAASDDGAGKGGDTAPAADFTAGSGFALTKDSLTSTGVAYKVGYVGYSWDNTVEHCSDLMGSVLESFGCEYQAISSNGDPDTFISNIESYISQGYDALIANTYSTTTGRATELLGEAKIPWMPVSSPPTDYDDEIVNPYVAVDDAYVGTKLMDEALAWAKANWADFDIKSTYIYMIDVSVASELHARCLAMEAEAQKVAGDAYCIEIGDSIAEGGGFSPEVAYNMCVRTFAANPDVKYWIVLHPFDYYASGTSRAAEDYGITDRVCNVTCNGDNYLPILKDGTTGCWRFCLYWDNGLWGYLIGCGLYAMLSGACTADELWSDYKVAGTDFAQLRMASLVMGPDNYEQVLGFYDNYVDYDYFGYASAWDGTMFPVLDNPG